MDKLKVIFYKANKGNILDKIISIWTGGKYSHCEILYDNISYSSSGPDKGVRKKQYIESDEWDIIEIPIYDKKSINKLYSFYDETKNSKYDWIGLFFKFILNKNYPNKKYYCSEWCAICLNNIYHIGLNYNCSPIELYNQLKSKIFFNIKK